MPRKTKKNSRKGRSTKKTKAEKTEKEPKESKSSPKEEQLSPEAKKGILAISFFTLALLSILSMFGMASGLGEYLNTGLGYAFGWGKAFFPIVLIIFGIALLFPERYEIKWTHFVGLILFTFSFLGILHLAISQTEAKDVFLTAQGGGLFGYALSQPLRVATGIWASTIVLIAIFIASLIILFNTSIKAFLTGAGTARNYFSSLLGFFKNLKNKLVWRRYNQEFLEKDEAEEDKEPELVGEEAESIEGDDLAEVKFVKKVIVDDGVESADEKGEPVQTSLLIKPRRSGIKIIPPVDLLESRNETPSAGDIDKYKELIKKTLADFGIDVEMSDVNVGPTVTQYTLKPAEGVKLNKITTLSNDLALALAAHPIRIEAPIPGKSLVGIEIPNKAVAGVGLKEAINSQHFKKKRTSPLTIVLGRDVAGNYQYINLDKMPHLMIAGATGSGKSVCVNSVIVSLLYQNSPDDLKLILVDPKRVELTNYNGIPHLLTPVIHTVDKTINAFRWLVAEMERRFELFSHTNSRDIAIFNSKVTEEERVPYIVAIVDELADLMTVSGKEMEAVIVRLAQMARAVGIHLVLATQRPSVEIITGLIKANIPGRIAFSVASLIDSRTILDFSGAEKLLGKGDMLHMSATLSKPKRIQGCFLADAEIERIVSYYKSKCPKVDYDESIIERQKSLIPGRNSSFLSGGGEDFSDDDELINDAKQIILQSDKASASLLQRRLRIGYARAARILDILEERSFIGSADGAKPREVLANDEAYQTESEAVSFDSENEPEVEDEDDKNDIDSDFVEDEAGDNEEEIS